MDETVTGAEALVRALEDAAVETVFGLPGGAILPAYDPLMDSSIRHVLVRHEQGAGHAAQGYAQATGKVGVCMATSGPGATNLVTPIADAHMDSVPLVAITGQVPSKMIGTDSFQEADIVGITMPITKHSHLVTSVEEIPRVVAEAFHLASTGRPGPVLIDVPKDVLQARGRYLYPPSVTLPGYALPGGPDPQAVTDAAGLLAAAKRPVLYVGGGVLKAHATRELAELATLSGAPVVTTLMARGAYPDRAVAHLGMPGMHGSVAAVTALQRSDLVVALGARFDDRVTGRLDTFATGAKVVHIDVDAAELSKNRHADVEIHADAKEAIRALTRALAAEHRGGKRADLTAWTRQCQGWKSRHPVGYETPSDGTLAPQHVISRLGELARPGTVYTSGVGQHQMWAAQLISYDEPYTWLNSGGLGTMGYAVPAAMGAKVGRPEVDVWAVDGDGCFQMTNQELTTCTVEGIPIKVALINNGTLGMVRQWQNLFYGSRYSNTDLRRGGVPDFVKLAEAMGCVAERCERPEDVDGAIRRALEVDDAPVVVEFVVGQDAQVWPMVAAGASNDEIQVARDQAPVWDTELGEAGLEMG